MTIKQLKKVHTEIMDLIVKSKSEAATVSFRRYETFGETDYHVDVYDNGFFEAGGSDYSPVYLHNNANSGVALVAKVRGFLFPEPQDQSQPDPMPVPEYRHTMEQMFPKFRPISPLSDEWFAG